jgi:hypothetical protein
MTNDDCDANVRRRNTLDQAVLESGPFRVLRRCRFHWFLSNLWISLVSVQPVPLMLSLTQLKKIDTNG